MTQQRSNEAIREHVAEAVSDYCIHVGPIPPDESVCHDCRRIADAVFDADVAPLLARVSELEQENARLRARLDVDHSESLAAAVERRRREAARLDAALHAGLSLQEEQE